MTLNDIHQISKLILNIVLTIWFLEILIFIPMLINAYIRREDSEIEYNNMLIQESLEEESWKHSDDED